MALVNDNAMEPSGIRYTRPRHRDHTSCNGTQKSCGRAVSDMCHGLTYCPRWGALVAGRVWVFYRRGRENVTCIRAGDIAPLEALGLLRLQCKLQETLPRIVRAAHDPWQLDSIQLYQEVSNGCKVLTNSRSDCHRLTVHANIYHSCDKFWATTESAATWAV
jgi:hypothetical protein